MRRGGQAGELGEGVPGADAAARAGGLLPRVAGALAATLESERPRWFLWLPVFLGAGIAIYFSVPNEPTSLAVTGFLVLAVALRILWHRSLAGTLITAGLVAMATGFALAKVRTERTRAPVIERTFQRADVRGIVELVEPRPKRGERLTLRVTAIEGVEAAQLPRRARIRTMVTTPGLKPGDHVKVRAKIGPPPAPSLPGDYDFARAAWYLGIGATGYALSKAEIETAGLSPQPGESSGLAQRWSVFLEDLRQRIGQRVVAALPGETGAIATALITGERGAITEETNASFRDSGLFHILSISGLHMVVMAGAAFLGVRRLLALFPVIALRYPIKKWAAAAALLAAVAYLNISGSSVATVRSAVMIAIIFLAVLIDRPALAMRNVALSALLILAVMPESLLDAGFQMSYAAVISLVAVYEVLRQRTETQARHSTSSLRQTGLFFGGIVMSTLIASFSVAPLAAYHFHKTQQYAVLANLIAIPVCNILVMPAGLLTLIALPLGLEAVPLMVMGFGIDVMVWAAATVAALPGAVGHVAAIPHLSLMLMIAGGIWLSLWQTRWRLAGLALAAAGLATAGLSLTGVSSPGLSGLGLQSHGDILAGRDGTLVAVRDAHGALQASPGRHTGFELQRWLENDGDARTAVEASKQEPRYAPGSVLPGLWHCDASGCIATVRGVTVAVVRHPSALPEDCGRAQVLILPFPKPDGCTGPEIVLDPRAFWSEGTHVISIDDPEGNDPDSLLGAKAITGPGTGSGTADAASRVDGSQAPPGSDAKPPGLKPRLHVETVAARRGKRPWTVALGALEPRRMQSPLKAQEPQPVRAPTASQHGAGLPGTDDE